MIADIRFWERKASEGHYAIPHFNVWNAEMLMGVIDAAEELRAPIIISFGTGFTGILPSDIEILRNEKGAPYVNLYGKAKEVSDKLGIDKIHISLSDTKESAIAYVEAERSKE